METSLYDIIAGTIEYRQWGLNVSTGFFLFTVLLTMCFQVPGLWDQVVRLSPVGAQANGISAAMMFVSLAYFVAFASYAWKVGSAGGVVNAGFLGPLFLPILWHIWRIRGFLWHEWIAGAWCVSVAGALFFVPAGALYLAASAVGALGIATQPVMMFIRKTGEGASRKYLSVSAGTSAVWIFYTATIHDLFMCSLCVTMTCLYGWAYALTRRYAPS